MARPAPSAEAPLQLRFGPFELDEAQARLLRDGQPVAIAPRLFAVLCALARRAGQLVTKDGLLDTVWGHQYVSDSVLKTTISELRMVLGDDARQPRYIETASRRGYRFIGVPAAQAAPAPMPQEPAAMQVAPQAIVGRGAALQRLHAAWHRAQTAALRQFVWVSGEAGIGKTTLIEHFVATLGAARVAHGQCVEQHGAGEPYLPVLEAVAALCRTEPALAQSLREVAPTWFLQLPWLGTPDERAALRRELAGSGQERMLREMGEWLDRVTAERPLLLVTEDLHWSDHATIRLVDHLARRRTPARLLWLASFRSAEVGRADHPMNAVRHELRLHRLADEIVLEPFSAQEVADFAGRRGAELRSELVDELHRRTDGLPLFVASLLEDFVAHGHDTPQALPESLVAVIGRRIERLDPDELTLLEAASVVGVEFRCGLVAELLAGDADTLLARCERLARERQWLGAFTVERAPDGRLDGRCTFTHALVRQVFYQRVGELRRTQWHGAVARLLVARREVEGIAAAEIASHFERGHDAAAAMTQYVAAAEAALARFAPNEAMRMARRGLDLVAADTPGPERDGREMLLLGAWTVAASQVQGVTARATREAYERIDRLSASVPVAPSRGLELGLGWVQFVRGDYAGALAQAERVHRLGEQRDDALLIVAACHLTGATCTFQGRLAEAQRWLEQGITVAEGLVDRLVLAMSVVDLGTSMHARLAQALAHRGFVDRARAQIASAEARARAIGQPYARRLVLVFASFLEQRLDRPRAVQTLAETLQQLAAEHGIRQAEGPARWLRGWALARLGDPSAGHELIREGYALDAQVEMRRGRSGVLGYMAEASCLMQRWDQAAQELDEAFALADQMGERLFLPDLWALRARIATARGDAAATDAAWQAACAEAAAQGANWVELSLRAARCGAGAAGPADLAALREARGRITEGADTPLVERADALLAAR